MAFHIGRRTTILGAMSFPLIHAASAEVLTDLTIGLSSASLGAATPKIAKEMGLFAQHGIEAKFITMESANAATTALLSGAIKIALSGTGELVVAQGRGQKVVAFANAYQGLGATLVLANAVATKIGSSPDAPIAQRLKAVGGLLLATTSATSAYTVALKAAAQSVGSTVRFTYMSVSNMVAALEAGAIDGYFTSAPFWALPVIHRTGVVWISGPRGELPPEFTPVSTLNFQVMRDYAEANRELITRIIAVFVDLARAIDERPDVVKATAGKLYPDLDRATLDLLFASESLAWKTRPFTVADMAHEIAFVKSSGVTLPEIDRIDPASILFR